MSYFRVGKRSNEPGNYRVVVVVLAMLLPVIAQPRRASPGEHSVRYDRAIWKAKFKRPTSTPFPEGNRLTPARELLGRTLFFDPALSGSKSISCASCHNPGLDWGDGLPRGIGRDRKQLKRKTPTLLNAAWSDLLFWDGHAGTLEEQALAPITAPDEMNLAPERMLDAVSGRVYGRMFEAAYPGKAPSTETMAMALATFERTLVSGTAPFDRWVAGDESAIASAAKRGFDLFNTKANCEKCHAGWNLSDNGFHDVGVTGDDKGRGAILPLEVMQFAFKTPTLRNASRRYPYMHNGSEATLEDVIELYDKGGREKRPSLAPAVVALHLTPQEKSDLLAFLESLTSKDRSVEIPLLPR